MFTTDIPVRFNDCDALGHVNNGTYFTYMEEARTPIFQICNPQLDVGKWNLIVASARCDFLKQVHFGEHLTVFTWVGRVGNSSFVVEHAIQNRRQEWVARGQAVLIHYDYTVQRPAALPESVSAALRAHGEGPTGSPDLR
ncbi:MAG: thioesterase family protein [Firmicutes bacterium]|nr:thioesterase family protein [Bacillota bacterium]